MGENPDRDAYTAGADCDPCHADIFGDVTPKYILVSASGIERCPGYVGVLGNGSWMVTQTGDPCFWIFQNDDVTVELALAAGYALGIETRDGVDELFFDSVGGPCGENFENTFTNCVGGGATKNGIAVITWGPSIHP